MIRSSFERFLTLAQDSPLAAFDLVLRRKSLGVGRQLELRGDDN
jgi:hypothetical protein